MTTKKRAIIIVSIILGIILVAIVGMYGVSRRVAVQNGQEPLSFRAFVGLGDRAGTGTGINGGLTPDFTDGGTTGGLGSNPGTSTPDGSNGSIGSNGSTGGGGTGSVTGGTNTINRYNADGSINLSAPRTGSGGISSIFTNQPINLGNGGSIGTGDGSGNGALNGGSLGGGTTPGTVGDNGTGGGLGNGGSIGTGDGGGTDGFGNGGSIGGGGTIGGDIATPGIGDSNQGTSSGGIPGGPDLGITQPGFPSTPGQGTATPTAELALAECTSADVTIAFTPEEIARLNALQERFYAVAQTLRTDSDVKVERANYDNFKLKLDKLTELNNYCQTNAPRIANPAASKRVPTPFWRNPSVNNKPDSTVTFAKLYNIDSRKTFNYNPSNIDTFLPYNKEEIWGLSRHGIETALRINLW